MRAVGKEEGPGDEEEGWQLKIGMKQETVFQKFGLRLEISISGPFF